MSSLEGGPRLHLMQSRDRDPLFNGVGYEYAVDTGSGAQFMVAVRIAPICVHLLPLATRLELEPLARELVAGAVGVLSDGDEIRVGSDGAARVGERLLRRLLPLTVSA